MKAKIICPILLVLIIAGHLLANIEWQARNVGPDMWDQASYLLLSEKIYARSRSGGWAAFREAFLKEDRQRAPLVPAVWVGFYPLFGNTRSSAHWGNHIALVVLCLSVYGIGRRLAGPWCGLAAVWITMMFPLLFGLSRQLYVEFPLTAAAAAIAWLCIAAKGLRRYPVCFLLGVAIGAGLLVKITLPIFIVGPLLVALGLNVLYPHKKDPLVYALLLLLSLVLILVPAFLIAAPWFGYNLNQWLKFMTENVSGHRGGIYGMDILEYLSLHGWLTFFSIYLAIAAVLVALTLIFRKRGPASVAPSPGDARERRATLITVILWLGIPLIVGLYAATKDVRLIAPALPALGLLVAYLLVRITAGWTRAVAGVLLVLIVVPYYFVSFGTPFDSTKNPDVPPSFGMLHPKYFLGQWSRGIYACGPNEDDWKGGEVLVKIRDAIPEQMKRKMEREKSAAGVVVVTNHPFFEANWFQYLDRRGALEGGQAAALNFAFLDYYNENASPQLFARQLLAAHFVLVKDSGWQGPEFTAKWFEELRCAMRDSDLFEMILCGIVLPDGSNVVIFLNRAAFQRPVSEEEKAEFLRLVKRDVSKLNP